MNWYKSSQINHSRVRAKDYFQLMRELDSGVKNLLLLNKMIYDLEPAVMQISLNTVAMGHTASEMEYPCPDCNDNDVYRWLDYIDGITMMRYYDTPEMIEESGINPEEVEGETFICEVCNKRLSLDGVADLMRDETVPRGIMITDEIEMIWKHFNKIMESETFEDKFPHFEAVIEYVHRSGPISHWFIEGGEVTIDKYRHSQ